MDNKLNIQDLVMIINQYKEELASVTEQKMVLKALLDKQIKHTQELEKKLEECNCCSQDTE